MDTEFPNVYADDTRATAYADLEFPATYYLAFRDLPELFARHVRGDRALDFGCGAGRSTRLLKRLGFAAVGVDIAGAMIDRARKRDPEGDYRLLPDGDLGDLEAAGFDLILCAFPFDNIPMARKTVLFRQMRRLLADDGRIVNLVSAPEIYVHEWTSFSTRDFPENRSVRTGETARIVMLDVPDRRPVRDVFCTDADYRHVYSCAGLTLLETHRPLGEPSEPYPWVTETAVSPWAIYVLGRGRA
jgi:SAM-dependent methyltransferase